MRFEVQQQHLSPLKSEPIEDAADSDLSAFEGPVAGIDVGSRTTKVVILDKGCILSSEVLDTGVDAERTAETALARAGQTAGVGMGSIKAIVGTGYGRVALSFADKTATELSCHARGCHFLDPTIRTVVDVGGQDCKVIHLDAGGNMMDFIMNDKCAAGTGRFLEMAARTLELDLTDMAVMTADPARSCTINSMCVVFAETEIISLLAKRRASRDIVSGIYSAFAGRIGNMVKRLGVRPPMVFVGGVAKNRGLAQALAECLGLSFTPLGIDPQLTGALGAAALAMQSDEIKGCETCR